MKGRAVFWGFVFGVLAAPAGVLVIAIANRFFGLPFVPFDIFDFMVRILPGFILIPSIHLMSEMLLFFNVASLSSAAKLAEQAMALVMFVGMGGVAGGVLGAIGAAGKRSLVQVGAMLGVAAALAAVGITVFLGFPGGGAVMGSVWLVVVFTVWGAVLGWLVDRAHIDDTVTLATSMGERSRLLAVSAAVFVLAGAAAIMMVFMPAGEKSAARYDEAVFPSATMATEEALAARIEPAPGTRPEITPVADFYRIDINTRPLELDGDTWRLEVTGLVDRPAELTLDDIRAYPPVSVYATMSCISNPIGGPLISTGLWTGVPLITVLEDLGLQTEDAMVYAEAPDGFYETVSRDDMLDPNTLLVYELNGEPLNAEQGFPLRFFIPDRYGMKQPKWVTRLTVMADNGAGFWVDRGWDHDAVVQLTSAIDVVATDHPDPDTGAVPIGGIAYGGGRGISRVEVRVDDGPWEDAVLRIPALSRFSWVQWRYGWPPASGSHTVTVRAYDGTGVMQTAEVADVYPKGATGYHSVRFEW